MHGEGMTDQAISTVIGVSRERVRQIRQRLGLPRVSLVNHFPACANCGEHFARSPDGPRQTRCPQHRQWRHIEPPSKRPWSTKDNAVRMRAYQQSKRDAGLCIAGRCKAMPRAPGTSMCESHAAAMRSQARTRNAARKDQGLCRQCGAPANAGAFCRYHRDLETYHARKRLAARAARGRCRRRDSRRGPGAQHIERTPIG